MGRLIDLQHAPELPDCLTLGVGDVLQFGATGGRIRSGAGIVQMLGPFIPAVLATNGEILSPMSAPNTVFYIARRPGRATVEVITGDPWHAPQTTTLQITVKPS
jgi:hypothetical protein